MTTTARKQSAAASTRRFVFFAQLNLLSRSSDKGGPDLYWTIWHFIRRLTPARVSLQSCYTRKGSITSLAPCRQSSTVFVERSGDEANRRVMEFNQDGVVQELIPETSRIRKAGSACSDGDVLYCINLAGWGILRRRLEDGKRLSTIGLPFFQDDDYPRDVCVSNSRLFLLTLERCRIYTYLLEQKEWRGLFDVEGGVRSFDATGGSDSDERSQFLYVVHGAGSRPHEIHYRRSCGEVLVTTLANAWSCKFVPNTDGLACAVSAADQRLRGATPWSVCLVDLYSSSILCTSDSFLGCHIRFMAVTSDWGVIVAMGSRDNYELVKLALL
ncbi:hypothetical protein FOZ63_022172 [Perkinsus olseni]|uniref:DUF295 domain-containing protein n=1 Tax=Perkinsus olseni TaxID=32597 RepID=A0A7J6S8K9_PEROL|nr:hypothetical protein FOZ63_022172 [Perkinsus olseni]